jgi:predicted TIM-barrel fold metal-dependent hydrolase
MAERPYVIALEEHFQDPELGALYGPLDANAAAHVRERLESFGGTRLKDMDEAGVDFQVISHSAPSVQKLDAETAVRMAPIVNDRLHVAIGAYPTRFGGFATIPTPDPKAAADELERAVTKLGFKGAMIHGMTNGRFNDEPFFWPIYERAQELDVPIYFHPSAPNPAVIEAYYKEYVEKYPMILRAAWGFTVETATQGLRLVLSGVFDKYPKLKVIFGHLGEGLPFLQWRINMTMERDNKGGRGFRDVFSEHFYVTTSGFWSDPALLLCVQELGVDHILFSVDWPFAPNKPATEWLHRIPLSAEDRAKIANGNARRLLKL